MFSAILILLILPLADFLRGLQFKPASKLFFFIFVANFLALMVLGAITIYSAWTNSYCYFFC
jgi:ubiquinol-cytochrome c reductase cytochrome b subunit